MIDPIIDHQRQHHHHQNHLPNYQAHQPAIISSLNQQHFQQQRQHQQPGHELIGYYFGSISRETAEWILKTHGNSSDGAYLLRSSGPNDDFVLSLLVVTKHHQVLANNNNNHLQTNLEVLHYKIIETEDSFVALYGQVGDEKFSTIDDLIDKAQGIATKPRWPVLRLTLDSQILPPTYWGLSVDQVRLAILIKAKQWGLPLLSPLIHASQQAQPSQISECSPALECNQQHIQANDPPSFSIPSNVTTLYNETIRTLIYKSLHEFQPWFHGKISREEAEQRIRVKLNRDGRFLVRERDNNSYAMCINHKKTPKHYRIDVLPTGEIAIQDGRKFTSLMALVSHYTIMNDGLWCALTEACPRPIATTIFPLIPQASDPSFRGTVTINNPNPLTAKQNSIQLTQIPQLQNLCYLPPPGNKLIASEQQQLHLSAELERAHHHHQHQQHHQQHLISGEPTSSCRNNAICSQASVIPSLKGPIKVWLNTMNHKLSQLITTKSNQQHSLDSYLFSNQKNHPLNSHCIRHERVDQHKVKCKSEHLTCGCLHQPIIPSVTQMNKQKQMARGAVVNATAVANSGTQQGVMLVANGLVGLPNSNKTNDNNFYGLVTNQSGQSHSCCNPTNCSVAGATMVSQQIPTNLNNRNALSSTENHLLHGGSLNVDQSSSSSLPSRLPQNGGFNLISQSIIGSPLFAVRQTFTNRLDIIETGVARSGSSTSGSESVEEEKLISPVHSIRGVNHAYNLNQDIYSSQTSTALINDSIINSSSSSSSSTNQFAHNRGIKKQMSDLQNLQEFNTSFLDFTNSISSNNVNKIKSEIDLMDWSESHAFDLKLIGNSLYKPPSPDQACESALNGKSSSVLSSILPESKENEEQLNELKKKHDLDEITTALLAELTASLKAQVELNNKRCGFVAGLHQSNKTTNATPKSNNENLRHQQQPKVRTEVNPLELINEFDTLISK